MTTSPSEQLSMGRLARIDQEEEYRRLMGSEALERQKHLANVDAGRCSCEPRKLKRKWEGGDRLTTRAVHDKTCAKWKGWMDDS